MKYLRERERLFGADSTIRVTTENIDDDGKPKERDEDGKVKKQEVYVLTGGFVEWQEKYIYIKSEGSEINQNTN